MNGDFISVGEVLKLVPPFKRNKQESLGFIVNVDTALAMINHKQEAILYKIVLTHVSGGPGTAVTGTSTIGRNVKYFCKTLTYGKEP
jgi:hypothetical protein